MPFDVTENTQTVIISAFEQLGKDSMIPEKPYYFFSIKRLIKN